MNTFVRIVSAGSFSLAAKQLNTSQPTVSRQLRTLEAHLGLQLLNRTTHGISLTEVGRRYYDYARALSEEVDRFESELRGETKLPCGLLRVVVPSGFGQDRLVGIAARYLKAYPAARLEWRLSESPVRFVDDAIDCAIQIGTIQNDLLVARELGAVNKIVAATPALLACYGSIDKPEDLARLPWVALSNHHSRSIHLQDRYGNLHKVDIAPNFIADSMLATRQAALMGMGATLISHCAVYADIDEGRLTHVLPEWTSTSMPIHLVYPKSRHYPLKLCKFVDLISALSPQFFSPKSTSCPSHFAAHADALAAGGHRLASNLAV